MSKKLLRKDRIKNARAGRQLAIQIKRVQIMEDFMIDNIDPVECPVNHQFTDNKNTELNTYCREFFVPAGTILTGTIYKIECFWFLVKGRMRLVEGDHTREIEAPCILKNVVGIKNSGYAHEDCLFYGVIPNPKNTRDLHEIVNIFSALPAEQIQGMGGNKQELNYQKRLLGAQNAIV
jgi:hypothetical protein